MISEVEMGFVYGIHLYQLFLVILAPSLLVGLVGVWLVRRYGLMLHAEDNDTAALAHAFVGVLYAVALGLMVVGVQSGHSEVETVVMKEANQAGDIYMNAEGLSGESRRGDIQSLASKYIEAVIDDEWPQVSKGKPVLESTEELINRLSRCIISYRPNSDADSGSHYKSDFDSDRDLVVYAELLSGINNLLDLRRERLHLGSDGVGRVTWAVVILGALVTIGMGCIYNTRGAHAHYGLVTCMSLMFGLMIFLIVAMDHPLWGEFSVQSTPFEVVRDSLLDGKDNLAEGKQPLCAAIAGE